MHVDVPMSFFFFLLYNYRTSLIRAVFEVDANTECRRAEFFEIRRRAFCLGSRKPQSLLTEFVVQCVFCVEKSAFIFNN